MTVFFLIFMISLAYGGGPLQGPIQIPESFKPYGELIERLYTTEDLTFEDAYDMVEPLASELYLLRTNPHTPQLLFLSTQKTVFEAEEKRQKALWKTDPQNKFLEQKWFLMWSIGRDYETNFFKRGDFTIFNNCHAISSFFALITTPLTDINIFPLHIHKLLFLMYISQFLGSISHIVIDEVGFFKDDDGKKPFLEVFHDYLRESITECGTKLFEHALWILKDHVEYVSTQEEVVA
jgi:hypothetical protein